MDDRSDLRVLFLGHDASRSGAPLLLLHFLRWLRSNTSVNFEVALKWDGPLSADYQSIAPTLILNSNGAGTRFLFRFLRGNKGRAIRKALHRVRILRLVKRWKPTLIYANTVVVADEAKTLAAAGCPVLWHIHEMPFNAWLCGGRGTFEDSARCATHFIAASQAVKNSLITNLRLPESKIDVVHEFIEPPNLDRTRIADLKRSIRSELTIPQDAFVIGMCGTMDWRKGADLFPILARHLFSRSFPKEVHLVWIGSGSDETSSVQMRHDFCQLGLADRLHLTGSVDNALPYLAALDVFALMSREDPFPLAMLEAASLGLPVICFQGSGGTVEFIEGDAGKIVEYLDVSRMAEVLLQLANDPLMRQRLGDRAREKVLNGYTSLHQAPKLFKVLRGLAESHLEKR
jgi:glycosyltransferase involved in cell wall biosynthesis